MRLLLLVVLTLSFSLTNGQNKKSVEISGSINLVEPVLALGNLQSIDSKIFDGGNYTNKSLAFALTGKYFIAENIAIRLKTVYTKRNIKDYLELFTGSSHSLSDIKFKQQILKLAPGIQWSMPFKKISFFGGFDLPLTFHGESSELIYNLSESANGTNQYKTNITYTIPGGTSFGVGIFAGANFYIIKRLALGFEFGTACEYTSVGGMLERNTVTTGAVNSQSYAEHVETIQQIKFADFQAGINVTFKLK